MCGESPPSCVPACWMTWACCRRSNGSAVPSSRRTARFGSSARFRSTEVEVPEHLKLVIFRTLEELLANVAQHANASHVRVVLARDANELCLSVQDDGDGFDAALLGYGVHPRSRYRLAQHSRANGNDRWSLRARFDAEQGGTNRCLLGAAAAHAVSSERLAARQGQRSGLALGVVPAFLRCSSAATIFV